MVFALKESAAKKIVSPSLQVPHILVETADCTAIIMLQDLICEYHKGLKTFKVKI